MRHGRQHRAPQVIVATKFAIITGALSAANQNEWIAFIKKRLADKHLGLKLATIRPSDDDRDKAFAETQTIMKVNPTVKLIIGDLLMFSVNPA